MDSVTIAKNLVLMPPTPIASGTISFTTAATAAATVSANIATPVHPVSTYIVAVRNNATQTNIGVRIQNVRSFQATSVAFNLGTATFSTGLTTDTLVNGLFAAGATGARLVFSLGTAATAAEVVSADYQIWPLY